MKYQITTQKAFNQSFIELINEGITIGNKQITTLAAAVKADEILVRCMYHDYIDTLQKDGLISEALANKLVPPF